MPVKIRLMRIGATKRPFYRVVAVDERKKRTGGYLELLGTYNPLTTPKEILLKQDRIDAWIKNGAQPSDGFLRIIGKAPQRLPRKPKKEKSAPVARAAEPKQEAAEEQNKAEEKTEQENVMAEEVTQPEVAEKAETETQTPEQESEVLEKPQE